MSDSSMIMDDFLAGGPLESVDVVDCHVHLGPALYMQVPDSGPEGLIRVLDALGISIACVSHTIAMVSDWKLGNSELIAAMRQYPGRIWGYTFFNPCYPSEMPEELARCAEAGVQGLKIHPDFHRVQANDSLYQPLYEWAVETNKVVLCHYGCAAGGFAGCDRYAEVCKRYPTMRCVMAHSLPNRQAVDTAVKYFGDNPNVRFCLANAFEPGVVEYACEQLGVERLLFGSDGGWGSIAARLGLICALDLDDETKSRILGKNMQALIDE